jgi:RNA polymerase sigma factor (sigma-70 family)
MTGTAPRIHVVDDDISFRTAIARLLSAAGYEVALYESGDHFLRCSLPSAPGCILLDLSMTGMDGLELQKHLNNLDSVLPVIFLTGRGDIPASVSAIKAGAEDFLTKPIAKEKLLATIEHALMRYRERQGRREQLDSLRARISVLTPREREVFSLVVRGRLNKQIAFELGTSERTVKAHRHQAMEKLGVRSVAAAVSVAERLGMLSEGERRESS